MAFRYAPVALDVGGELYFRWKLCRPFLEFKLELTCDVIRNEHGSDEERRQC